MNPLSLRYPKIALLMKNPKLGGGVWPANGLEHAELVVELAAQLAGSAVRVVLEKIMTMSAIMQHPKKEIGEQNISWLHRSWLNSWQRS